MIKKILFILFYLNTLNIYAKNIIEYKGTNGSLDERKKISEIFF